MRKFYFSVLRVALIALVIGLLAGCNNIFGSNDDDSSSDGGSSGATTENLPSSFSVSAPKSVRSGGDGTSGSSVSASNSQASGAYDELTSQVEWMEMEQQNVGLEFIIADEMIGDAFQLGTASSGTYTFEITQAVVDNVLALFRASSWWEDFGAELEDGFNQLVGESFPIEFAYEPISTERYDHKLETTYSEEGVEDVTTLYWDSDKENVSLVFEYEDTFDGETFSGRGVYTYNDTTKTATAINEFTSNDFSDYTEITLREASDEELSAKNGVFVTFNSRGQFSGFNYRYNTRGYADDEGGEIRITSTYNGDSFSEEYTFDVNGEATVVEYAFLDDTDFGDMSGAEVIGDIGLDDAGFFRISVSGVTKDAYYLITNTNATPDFDSNVVGDAGGISAGELEVMLWDTAVASGTTLYAFEYDFDADSPAATATGSFANP